MSFKSRLTVCAAVLCYASAISLRSARIIPLESDSHGADVTFEVEGKRFIVVDTEGEGALVWGSYNNTVNTTGFGSLEIHGNASMGVDDVFMAYAAGYLEGTLMPQEIYDFTKSIGADTDLGPVIDTFLNDNRLYIQGQVASNPTSAYWKHVNLVYKQLDGLAAGYADTAPSQLHASTFLHLQLQGDLFDLIPALGITTSSSSSKLVQKILRRLDGRFTSDSGPTRSITPFSHCSALFRLLPDGSDLLAAHTTWSSLESMLRTYKLYDLPFSVSSDDSSPVPGIRHIQSSYPGQLVSLDDHYVTTSGLIIIETTINNNNQSLYTEFITPKSVLEWHRNVVANRLAASAPSWMQLFGQENSGTYNNEWMVFDAKLYTPHQPLVPDTFWVGDQMPGYFVSADQTALLQSQGYFPSYNVPFYPEIFNVSNQWPLVEQYGDFFTWDKTARANIFARDVSNVVDLQSMQLLMRENKFQTDPLSKQGCGSNPPSSAIMAISARMDLNPSQGDYKIPGIGFADLAGIDSKIASAKDASAAAANMNSPLVSYCQFGPTYDNQPAFSWSNTSLTGLTHAGQPTIFNFPWVKVAF